MRPAELIAIPEDYLCPITQELMENPVVAADGQTYERASITQWFIAGHRNSPLTLLRLDHTTLIDNHRLKAIIETFKASLPEIQRQQQIKVDLSEAIRLHEIMVAAKLEEMEQKGRSVSDALENERRKVQVLEQRLAAMATQLVELTGQSEGRRIQNDPDRNALEHEREKTRRLEQELEQMRMTMQWMQDSQNRAEPMPAPAQVQPSAPLASIVAGGFFEPTDMNQIEINKFVTHVAKGEQDEAEAMLRQNRRLALGKGRAVEHCGRIFENITGLQYAVWALDWHMWEMIKAYMTPDAITEQLHEQETITNSQGQGAYFDLTLLIEAMSRYSVSNKKWLSLQGDAANKLARTVLKPIWFNEIIPAQKKFPAHIAQEYCHPDRSFVPIPNFDEKPFKRSLKVFLEQFYSSKQKATDWWAPDSELGIPIGRNKDGTLEYDRGINRTEKLFAVCGMFDEKNSYRIIQPDLNALTALFKNRTQKRQQLFSTYGCECTVQLRAQSPQTSPQAAQPRR